MDAVESSPLSKAHIENIYRNGVASAYSEGQKRILDHPLVTTQFPYAKWSATRDSRTRPDHAAMEYAGLDGTAIYNVKDPQILRAWPPCAWQCRCKMILLSLRQAAAFGVKEAARWLESGMPPAQFTFVESVPVIIPPGWERRAA